MHCQVCRDTLRNICDPSKVKRICSTEWFEAYCRRENISTLQDHVEKLPSEKAWRDPEELNHWAYGHHGSWQSLQESRNSNCNICRRLWPEEVPEFQQELSFASVITFTDVTKDNLKQELHLDVYSAFTNWCFFLYTTLVNNTLSYLEPSTSSPTTWGIIQHWLHGCVEGHECDHRTDKDFLPTRLLELTISDAECSFRLVHKHEVAPGVRYLTLSHCWGSKAWNEKLVLTETNLGSLRQKQNIDVLPQTFQDAFIVLKRLGARYLWIDRLCIQQDSIDDWRVESASMEEVYSNSYLTIAALGAENDEGGCFFTRQDFLDSLDTIQVCFESPQQPITYNHSSGSLRHSWTIGEPLLERAWVLQERFLSPRVVYFGSRQVFWECYELHTYEQRPGISFNYKPPSKLGKRIINNQATRSTRKTEQGVEIVLLRLYDPENEVENMFRDWYQVLSDYTRLKLTNPEDKLVAISAVAKRLRKLLDNAGLNSEYVAGIWQQRLPYSLIWFLRSRPPPLSNARVQVAPSWSWAAVNAGCDFLDIRGKTSDATILVSSQFTVRPKDVKIKDPLVDFQGIKLVLWGTKLIAHISTQGWQIQNLGALDLEPIRAKEMNRELISYITFDDWKKYSTENTRGQKFECIPLVLYEDEGEDLPYSFYCMVVEPEGPYYRRIGMATLYLSDKRYIWEAIGSTPKEEFVLI
ncbi:HET-domain-containing protein [Periconia macrospinosa]|uniref:HET-domain-containing protein n=1 Tax=Periconia macrospinosa TaxID=97972 RepID=A0A2V1DX34_9PLEO|nr:HET-domain-containing protein [Periconia macrospinosa]